MKKSFSIFAAMLIPALYTGAQACSCLPPEPLDKAIHNVNAVLTGTVIDLQVDNTGSSVSSADPVQVTVKVAEVWKGDIAPEVTLITSRDSASCGFPFNEFNSYLIYSYDGERVSLCSNTQPLTENPSPIIGQAHTTYRPTNEIINIDCTLETDWCDYSQRNGGGLGLFLLLLLPLCTATRRKNANKLIYCYCSIIFYYPK